MSNEALPLANSCVLVVDDDFYLADMAREVLVEAGATVLGPYGKASDALRALNDRLPTHALIDLNLGAGPDFDVARALAARNVPTILVTGYDKSIIPSDLNGTPCLQKPITRSKLVAAVVSLGA